MNKSNWDSAHTGLHNDAFAVSVNGTHIIVNRIDETPSVGWGMDLRFYCGFNTSKLAVLCLWSICAILNASGLSCWAVADSVSFCVLLMIQMGRGVGEWIPSTTSATAVAPTVAFTSTATAQPTTSQCEDEKFTGIRIDGRLVNCTDLRQYCEPIDGIDHSRSVRQVCPTTCNWKCDFVLFVDGSVSVYGQ